MIEVFGAAAFSPLLIVARQLLVQFLAFGSGAGVHDLLRRAWHEPVSCSVCFGTVSKTFILATFLCEVRLIHRKSACSALH